MEFTLLWQTKMKSSARPAVCWEEQKAAGRGGQHRAQQRCSEAADSSGVSEGSSNSLKSRKCAQQGDVRGFVCSTPPWRQEAQGRAQESEPAAAPNEFGCSAQIACRGRVRQQISNAFFLLGKKSTALVGGQESAK